jgi:hypothetical protein
LASSLRSPSPAVSRVPSVDAGPGTLGVALWVEKTHGEAGADHIASDVGRLAAQGDVDGIAIWRAVALRYDKPRESSWVN